MRPKDPAWQLLKETGAELDGWTVPTQIVWGMRDPVFVPWFMGEFERRLPNHVRIEDASHFLQDDRPDRIIDAVRVFLQSAPHRVDRPQHAA
jgi:haloalkane dehalogenase